MKRRNGPMLTKADVSRVLDEHNRRVTKRTRKQWKKESRRQQRTNRWRTVKAWFWGRR